MWLLHSVATTYGCRPSEIVGGLGSWEAYGLDVAVMMVGREIENGLAERNRDGSAVRTLDDLLDGAGDGGQGQQFAALAGRVTKTMAVPESGIW